MTRYTAKAKQKFIDWLLADEDTYLPETHVGPNSLKVGSRDITDEDNSTTIYDGSAQEIGDGNQSVNADEHTINDLSVLLEKTADQSISADTDTTVDWDSQDVDSNIYSYNTSADTIDILNAGDYHISVYYRISGISSGDLLYVRLYLNGSLQRIFTHEANSASDERFGLSYTEKDLAANDTLRFDVRSSADTTLKGDTQSTFASLTRSG